jgi:hypothetical protein
MFVEPGIQVKTVIHAATPKAHMRHIQLSKQRDPDPEVNGRLFLGQATNRGQRQAFIHDGVLTYQPLAARR